MWNHFCKTLVQTKRLTVGQNKDGKWGVYSGERRTDRKRRRTMVVPRLKMTGAIEDEGR